MLSIVAGVARVILALISLRGNRWAYVAFIVLGLAYFPARVGWRLNPHSCELTFSAQLAAFSLTNFAHITLFAIFFIISSAQTGPRPSDKTVLIFSGLATLAMGALVEIAEGLTGQGHCRVRDLIPDSAGVLLGAAALFAWRKIRRTPTLNPFAGLRAG